jgi:hypothetical protein
MQFSVLIIWEEFLPFSVKVDATCILQSVLLAAEGLEAKKAFGAR